MKLVVDAGTVDCVEFISKPSSLKNRTSSGRMHRVNCGLSVTTLHQSPLSCCSWNGVPTRWPALFVLQPRSFSARLFASIPSWDRVENRIFNISSEVGAPRVVPSGNSNLRLATHCSTILPKSTNSSRVSVSMWSASALRIAGSGHMPRCRNRCGTWDFLSKRLDSDSGGRMIMSWAGRSRALCLAGVALAFRARFAGVAFT